MMYAMETFLPGIYMMQLNTSEKVLRSVYCFVLSMGRFKDGMLVRPSLTENHILSVFYTKFGMILLPLPVILQGGPKVTSQRFEHIARPLIT